MQNTPWSVCWLKARSDNFFAPKALSEEDFDTHTPDYFKTKRHEPKSAPFFEMTPALVERGVIMQLDEYCMRQQYGVAMNVAGGTAPCVCRSWWRVLRVQWCLYRQPLTAQSRTSAKILIVDLDVHQGNGQRQYHGEWAARFCFSMHELPRTTHFVSKNQIWISSWTMTQVIQSICRF